MNHYTMPPFLRRWIAGVLAALIGLGPMFSAYAALTPLADEPLNTKNSARPNVVLTVDDSTSMLFDFLPDYVVSNYCRGGLGGMTAACGSVGAANDFTAVGGGKYFSPGYTAQQYSYPYPQYTGAGSYDASGPGAGCYPGSPPTCSPGVNPAPLPGLEVYPAGPQPSWPNAGKPYEYWLLWPAPPHSAALNAIYYDPRITYDPPVDSTGASFPQMDAAGTSNWTQVPADPWAASITYVDLTTSINVGQWCNSDWSLGLAPTDPTDPNYGKVCRFNGSGAAAFSTVTASQGQDYTYPWAPVGFTLSASPGSTTANTYAAQKVTLNATLTGTAINAANWNATTKDSKFYFENENIIWCDPTSPSWPQTGPVTVQVCANVKLQTCSAIAQVCNKSPGACNNYIAPKCNGVVVGTCNGTSPAACNGTAGVCNNPPTCNNPGCGNIRPQTCNGTNQTCPTSPQTCSGPFGQTCILPGTQTCQPPVCSVTYNPPGCNLLPPDPENPCNPVTTCQPPVCTPDPGHCSIQTGLSCTQDSQCVPQPGACSVNGASCMKQSDCANVGHCSILGNLCQSVADCTIVGGTCSKKGTPCTKDTDCPGTGTCSSGTNAGAVCLVPSDCYYCSTGAQQVCPLGVGQCTPGTCSQRVCADGVTPCTTNANCVGHGGTCNAAANCFASNTCPVKNGTCAFGGNACTLSTQCSATPGQCNKQNGQPWSQKPCTGNAQCLTLGTCNVGGAACASDPDGCPEQLGTCAKDPTVTCRSSSDCSSVGTCANTHAACNSQVPCANVPGVCSLSGLACTTVGTDPVCLPTGACSVTGATCTCPNGTAAGGSCASPACPQQPGPLPPNAARCDTTGVGGNAAVTLRHDAETNGVVCRRNNQTSAGAAYSSGAYDYPSGKFLTPITGANNALSPDACPATDHFVAVPRQYWKSSVQWCDAKITTPGDQWLGYGTDVGGTCQPGKDSTHIYPRFFEFGQPSYVNNYTTAAFQRVALDITKRGTATYTHNWIDVTNQPQTITRTFDQEMTNYANWFAYYRTRIQAVKTVTSLTFTVLDDQYRVGFHTLSNGLTTATAQSDPAKFVDVQDFTPGQKAAWFAQLFAITIPLRLETPTLDAMQRIGDYFLNGGSPQLQGSTDPIILSCQKNWHMLFTDGFTNQPGVPGVTVGDQDDTVPALPDPVVGLTPGNAWPHPFQEDPNAGAANAASDYAMKYWVTDLRPNGPFAQDNVPGTAKDPAIWQHLNFAALSLGTQGKLPIANQSLTENLLAAGTLQWPQPIPNVWHPDNSGVDDLWHAAINGRGRFVNAQTAEELKLGMGQILQDITNQAGARAGAGFASSSISLTNNSVYIVTFQPGWAGTLSKVTIDPVTGIEAAVPTWEAATQLSAQLTPTVANPTPWFTNRNIFTVKDGVGGGPGAAVPFLWGNLSAAQQDSLAPGQPAVGQAVLEFLRGNPTNEGVAAGQFRVRGTGPNGGEDFLGDIVDSQAVYVGPPNSPYNDATDPGYSGFVSAQQGRPARIYVGANDGMVHAFDDANGNESWAFIPHDLYRPDATGLGALAYQDGALPPFRHHFYVDSTPRVWDVNFGGGPSDWHSLLVGGLGKGGKSYYGIDVTDPASVSNETTAAQQYLWTFTDADMGYSYGRPFLTKTHATVGPFTDGQWVAVVSAGYNNPSGLGKIFFVDAKTGVKLKEMDTGFGTPASPSGLVQVIGYTNDFHNQLAEQIYGGDLYGNFWRFDVQDPDPANWTVHLLASLTDPAGNPQPVTAKPATDVDITNGVDRWVFVGTGRLLDDTDLTDPSIANQQQTLYAIRDGTATAPKPFTATLQPRTDLTPLTDKVAGLASKPPNGWFDDLPPGQRITTSVVAALSLVAYAGTEAQDNPCLTGQPAVLYVRSFAIGETLLPGATAATAGGIDEPAGAVGLAVTIFSDSSGVQSAGGLDIRVGVTTAAGTIIFQTTITQQGLGMGRMSWRLFGQ